MIPNLKLVSPGIWRGGQPENEEDYRQLSNLSILEITKLNSEKHEEEIVLAWKYGIRCFYVPIPFIEQLITEPCLDFVRDAVGFIQPGSFIHCEHGQDRTGLVIGLYRVLIEKWPVAKARQEMLDNGYHSILAGLEKAWYDLTKGLA